MSNNGIVHVIDDDDAMRESLAFLFKSAKVPVATYANAAAFLDQLAKVQGAASSPTFACRA